MTHLTVAQLIDLAQAQFAAADLSYGHGTDNAWDEAVALVLGVAELADDVASLQVELEPAIVSRIEHLVKRRVEQREPLPYLLGHCQYMGWRFHVQPGVIVPRSPIGYLLQEGLGPWLPRGVGHVVDLCCGSGCLGIIAAHVFADAQITLVDLSAEAVDCARRNVAEHALQDRVRVLQADVCGDLPLESPVDLIISNPPYVDAADMAALPPEYQAEPAMALAAGDDGLSIIRQIMRSLPHWLAPGGLFIGEVGASAPALARAYPQLPFIWPELVHGGEGVFLLEEGALTSHTARL